MGTKFADFMRGIEEEAEAEGPEAVEELEVFRDHFRLGRQLAVARRARKMTQAQVASIARVDQADVSKMERGVSNPTFTTMNAVAAAVGLELNFIKRAR